MKKMTRRHRFIHAFLSRCNLSTFEMQVLLETLDIKPGTTVTYKEMARHTGRERAYRAVGNALNKNPLPILIPCHRVVSGQGTGGYKLGSTLKKILLRLESLA